MARIYEQYITGEDREFAIMEAESALFNDKMNFLLETIEKERELNKREAEYIVLKESGTYDDLMYLYEEADKEADAKKQGVIGTIIAAIKGVINAIGNAFSNFGKVVVAKNPDQEIEVEKDVIDTLESVHSNWVKNIAKGVVFAAMAVVAALAGNHLFANMGKKKEAEDPNRKPTKIKMKAREIDEKVCKPIGDMLKKLESKLPAFGKKKEEDPDATDETITDANGTEVKNDLNVGQRLVNFIKGLINKIRGIKVDESADNNNQQTDQNEDQGGDTGQNNQGQNNNPPAEQGEGDNNAETNESSDDVLEDIDAFLESLMDTEYDDEMVEESYDEDEDILGALDAIFA